MNNKLKLSALSTAVILSLTGCGSDSDTTVEIPDNAPVASDVAISDVKQWMPYQVDLNAQDPDSDPISVLFVENGQPVSEENGVYTFSHGTLELDNLSITYINTSGEDVEFDYVVSANGKSAGAKVIISGVQSDPLAKDQWHLRNTGQKAFALSDEMKQGLIGLDVSRGETEEDATAYRDAQFAAAEAEYLVPGEDVNAVGAYAQGVSGAGVTAVVIDSALEIRHEDLVDNVLPNRSLNIVEGAVDKTDPTTAYTSGDHGTSVAGLIAAKGWNGIGGHGVAPDTGLIGMNYLPYEQGAVPVSQTELLIHGFPGSGISQVEEISAFNRSYGSDWPAIWAGNELDEEIESYPNRMLRGGKGATNIKSSGNSFDSSRGTGDFCDKSGAVELGLTCQNGNFESSQTHPYYFSVGAVNSNGKHTSYSTAGANLLVSAPAGEYGRYAPAMVTTDSMTCLSGYSGFDGSGINAWAAAYGEEFAASQLPFNYPGHPENPNCNYVSTFNGTSSAAPNASGVVSLILSANNDLTWRDVRHVLAATSTKIDADDPEVKLTVGEGEFVAHSGWVENAAGFSHNNLYGFGRVDAGAAVAMAKNYTVNLGEEVITEWMGEGTTFGEPSLDLAIPDNSAEGVTYTLTVEEELAIEAIQFKFDISNELFAFGLNTSVGPAQVTAGTDLAIEVTSPSGTRSVLLSSKQGLILPAIYDGFYYPGYILLEGTLLSNAFYGESAKGDWKIKLLDVSKESFYSSGNLLGAEVFLNNTTDSVLESAAVRIFGHEAN